MKRKKPIIGITTSNDQYIGYPSVYLLKAYVDAILVADGIPVLIPSKTPEPSWTQLLEQLDGVLFSGGGDISPDSYNGVDHTSLSGVDLSRDQIEIPMIKHVIQNNIPFLGICRGFQVLNVALGGSLYLDLSSKKPDSIKHDYFPGYQRDHLAHQVEIEPDSTIGKIMGSSSIKVNSLHHQGIEIIADMLKPVGFASDGLVEAVEVSGHQFGIAVQWHPECLLDIPQMKSLFVTFINASENRVYE
ncbi:gamma-glutamyl-gamma-aminobutyrate hydrolase family protein [Chloroflexota bacterium]